MQLQLLAPVDFFLKQLNGCSFSPGWNYYYYFDLQFSRAWVCHVYIFYQAGTIVEGQRLP